MTWLERSWYNNSKVVFLMAPLSVLFYLVSLIRKTLYKFGMKKQNDFSVPVIVVGNINVGGTGKTPFVIYLIELLKTQGFRPAIVSRGYGSEQDQSLPYPRLVTPKIDVRLSGDEPKLLAIKTQCPVVISANRSEAVNFAIKEVACDVVISDDGLQHYAMSRAIEIVLVDAKRQFGNGWLLPVGPLRELPNRLDSVDLVVKNLGFIDPKVDEGKDINDYTLAAYEATHLTDPIKVLDKKSKVHLVSGIGNPERFLSTVEGLGYQVIETHWFADHHKFTLADFEQFDDSDLILMTEKDAVKCRELQQGDIGFNWYELPIKAVLSKPVEQKLLELITQLK